MKMKRKRSTDNIAELSNVELHLRLALGKLMTMKKGKSCTL